MLASGSGASVRRTDKGLRSFTLAGNVRDESGAMKGVLVEAFQIAGIADILLDRSGVFRRLFHFIKRIIRSDKTDRLLGSALTDDRGNFRITYRAYPRYSVVYVTVCDSYSELHKEKIRAKGSGKPLSIVVKNQAKFDNPYRGSKRRMLREFIAAGKKLHTGKLDRVLAALRLLDFVEDFLFFISEHAGRLYGHPGLLVPKRPKERWPHNHAVPWWKR